jgi:hypothetical protein
MSPRPVAFLGVGLLVAGALTRPGAAQQPLAQVVVPARQPSRASLPAALDRDIPQITVPLDWPTDPFTTVAERAHIPLGVELLPQPPRQIPTTRDPRLILGPQSGRSVVVGPGTLSDALAVLLERFPEYELSTRDAIISIAPTSLLRSADHFMNRPIDRFEATDISIYRAVTRLRHAINPRVIEQDYRNSGGSIGGSSLEDIQRRQALTQQLMDQHVTLTIEHATPREILNRLAVAHGRIMWVASYEPDAASAGAPEAREDRCVIRLGTIGEAYGAVVRPVADPAPAPPAAPARAGPPPMPARSIGIAAVPPPPAASRLVVSVPVTAIEMTGALHRLSRINGAQFGIELLQAAVDPATQRAVQPGRNQYDLTGLPTNAVLDRLTRFLPDYTWSESRGVYHVRAQALQGRSNLALDRIVPTFFGTFANVNEALAAVHRLFDPTFPPRADAFPNANAETRAALTKVFSVSLTNVTVREILDEMAHQHGSLSWQAQYRDTAGGYPGMVLRFTGPPAWGVSMSAVVR